MKAFADWALDFAAFVEEVRPVLSQRIPNEVAQLQREQQELAPLLWRAHEWAAQAIGNYYFAKNMHMDKLMQEGWPKSSLDSVGKASSHAELKCKELAERVVETISSRSFKVSEALKLIRG